MNFTPTLKNFLIMFIMLSSSFLLKSQSANCDILDPGMIENNQTLCSPGDIPDTFINVNAASSVSGDEVEYLWISTTDVPGLEIVNWIPLPNSNTVDYSAEPLMESTYFRRCVRVAGCTQFIGESNIVYVCVDMEAPELVEVPNDLTIECSDPIPELTAPVAVDDCSSEIEYSYTIDTLVGACTDYYVVNWSAIDNCGYATTYQQTINTEDTMAPTVTLNEPFASMLVDNVITRECDDILILTPGDVTAMDNCDSNPVVTMVELVEDGDCPIDGYLQLFTCHFIATDACENVDTLTIQVKYVDTTNPDIALNSDHPDAMDGGTITIECPEDVVFAQSDATATDNCDENVMTVLDVVTLEGDCDLVGYISLTTYTWTATDHCGNSSTYTVSVKVIDETAPTLTLDAGIVDDQTITSSCDVEVPEPVDYTALDACDEDVEVVVNISSVLGNCLEDGYLERYTYEYVATDDCGNTATMSYSINIIDEMAPIIILDGYSEGETVVTVCTGDDALLFGMADALVSDNCDLNSFVDFNVIEEAGACLVDGYVLRKTYTWTAVDHCGNSSSYTLYENIVDETPPVITFVGNAAGYSDGDEMVRECDDILDLTLEDAEATDLVCSSVEGWDIASIIVEGDCAQNYSIVYTWTAVDACGNSASASLTVTYVDTTAPVVTLNEPYASLLVNDTISVQCNDILILLPSEAVTATDNCDESPSINLVEFVQNGECAVDGFIQLFTCHFIGQDDCGNLDTLTVYVKYVDTIAPTITFNPAYPDAIDGYTYDVECPEDLVFTLEDATVADECDEDVIIHLDIVVTEGNCVDDGYLSLTKYTWSSTDYCGNTGTYTVFVKAVDTVAPTLTLEPDVEDGTTIIINCGEDVPAPAEYWAEDICDQDVTVIMNESVTLGNCPEDGYIERYTYEYIAIDDCGNTTTRVYYINVIDEVAPTIIVGGQTNGGTVITSCQAENPYIFEFGDALVSDNCDINPFVDLVVDMVAGDCLVDGYVFRRTYTWTTIDHCGNSATFVIYEDIIDDTAPEISFVGAYEGLVDADALITECDTPLYLHLEDAQAFDYSCTYVTEMTIDSMTVAGDCPQNYSVVYTWSATDACGNTSTASLTVNHVDTTAPSVAFVDTTMIVGDTITSICSEYISFDVSYAMSSDNCDDAPVVTIEEVVVTQDCEETGYLSVNEWIFTSTDACGNSSSISYYVRYTDPVAPYFTSTPEYMIIDCGQPVVFGEPTFEDNCDADLTVIAVIDTLGENCVIKYTKTWTIIDDCGNYAMDSQTILTTDTDAPTFTELIPVHGTDCYNEITITEPTVADNCSMHITTTRTIDTTHLDGEIKYQINWTIDDGCLNSRDTFQIFQVPCPEGLMILDFDGRLVANDAVELEWTVLNEQLNGYYFVERRRMNGQYVELNRIHQNNGQINNEYSFVDENPLLGQNIYRIRYFSEEFGITESELVEIQYRGDGKQNLAIYPNPVLDWLNVDFLDNTEENAVLSVYSTSGTTVASYEIASGSRIYRVNVGDLPAGVYYMELREEGKKTKAIKLMRAH